MQGWFCGSVVHSVVFVVFPRTTPLQIQFCTAKADCLDRDDDGDDDDDDDDDAVADDHDVDAPDCDDVGKYDDYDDNDIDAVACSCRG